MEGRQSRIAPDIPCPPVTDRNPGLPSSSGQRNDREERQGLLPAFMLRQWSEEGY